MCFAATVLALGWAWGDLAVRAAKAPDRIGQMAGMTPQRWQRALDRLYQARALEPLNADYAAELGRHYAWLAWLSRSAPEASRLNRKKSRAAYAEAIGRRPSWGFAWANYAEASLLEGGAGDEARLALERAMRLAPWETRTQLKALLVGFSLWDGLDQPQQAALTASLQRALLIDEDVDLIVRMALQTGRESLLSNLLTKARHREILQRILSQSGRLGVSPAPQ